MPCHIREATRPRTLCGLDTHDWGPEHSCVGLHEPQVREMPDCPECMTAFRRRAALAAAIQMEEMPGNTISWGELATVAKDHARIKTLEAEVEELRGYISALTASASAHEGVAHSHIYRQLDSGKHMKPKVSLKNGRWVFGYEVDNDPEASKECSTVWDKIGADEE